MMAIRALVGISASLLLSGCLAGTGAAVALLSGDDGGSDNPPPPPPPPPAEPVIESSGLEPPVIPLRGTPVAMALGNFFGGIDLDVAVLIGDEGILSILEGDGQGEFSSRVDLELDVSFPKDVVKVPRAGSRDVLLVTDTRGLLVIQWNDKRTEFVVTRVEYDGVSEDQQSQQHIVVGDFDGQGEMDAAISLQRSNLIAVFLGTDTDGSYTLYRDPNRETHSSSPFAMAAADFDARGVTDIVVGEQVPLQSSSLRLLLNVGGKLFEQARLEVPELEMGAGATLEARDGATFHDTLGRREEDNDPFPDLIVGGIHGVFRIFVRDFLENRHTGNPFLGMAGRPTGPPTIAPGGAVLTQLPRGMPGRGRGDGNDTWDIVALDGEILSIEYGGLDNMASDSKLQRLSLPGLGRAIEAGYLDSDEIEDIVVAIMGPSLPDLEASSGLVVLLANPERELNANEASVEDNPLRYRQARQAGENPPPWENIDVVASGRCISVDGRSSRFLAVVRRRAEVVISYLDEEGTVQGGQDIYFLPPTNSDSKKAQAIRWVRAADLDGDQDDDLIVLSENTIRLLRNDGQGAFVWIGDEGDGLLVDLALYDDGVPELTDLNIRDPTIARIDPGEFPDIVCPASNMPDSNVDFIAVILNPREGATNTDVRFIRTRDNPRQVSVTEIDGDGFPDLLVSNKDSDDIEVLLGNPLNPGDFISGYVRNLVEFPGQVELTVTDLPDPGVVEIESGAKARVARFIVFATEEKVALLLNRSGQDGAPCPEKVCLELPAGQDLNAIATANDAEFVILADIFPDPVLPFLDLIVADEEAGFVKLFKGIKNPSVEPLNCFQFQENLRFVGRPDELTLFDLPGGGLALAASTKRRNLELYIHSCDPRNSCTFQRKEPIIDLSVKPVRGAPLGLSVARGPGGLAIASVLEDGRPITREAAIDFIDIRSPPLDPSAIRDIGILAQGSCAGNVCPSEILLDPEIAIDGVLVGRFDTENTDDLLIHDSVSGVLFIIPDGDASRVWAIDVPRITGLRGLNCVELSDSRHGAFLVTRDSTMILDPLEEKLTPIASFEDIIGAVPMRDDSGRFFSAALLNGSLVAANGGPPSTILAAAPDGLLGCARLNGDGHDDLVFVTTEEDSSNVFTIRVLSFRATGDMRFEQESELRIRGREAKAIAFPDANADSRQDLCIGTSKGTVIIVPGNGKGRFVEDEKREVFVWPEIEAVAALPLDDWGDEIIVSARSPGLFVVRTLDPKKTVR